MGNIWKRLLSMTLAIVMVLGMMPVPAFAAEDATDAAPVSQELETVETTGTEAVGDSAAAEATEPETTETPTQAAKPEKDAAVESVQALIQALPGKVGAQEDAEALNAALVAITDAIADLTAEQAQKLNMDKYNAAVAALEQWYAQDYSGDVLEDLVNCYWDGDTLYVKDGSAVDLYNALVNKTGYTGVKTVKYGADKNSVALFGTEVKSGSNYTIAPGTYYYYIRYNSHKTESKQFSVVYYYDLTARVAEGAPEGAGIALSANRVVAGNTVSITVNELEGYTATITDGKGNVIRDLDAYIPTESTTLTATYVSNAVTKYTVTLEVVGADYGTAELKTESTLAAGAEVLVSAKPKAGTENTWYCIRSVMTGDTILTVNGNGDYAYTMGQSDVTITVTFEKLELTASEKTADGKFIEVMFNGYVNAAEQMSTQTENYADVTKEKYLEKTVLAALGVKFNGEDVKPEDVSIQYLPYYYGALPFVGSTEGFSEAKDAKALNESAPKDTWSEDLKSGLKYYDFGQRFREGNTDAAEKIIISYQVDEKTTLSVTREISLAEGRKGLPSEPITTSSETVTKEAIQTAAAKAVDFVKVSADDFSLKENWESDLVSGEPVGIVASAAFAGNNEYIAGTIYVTVNVTKVSEPATIAVVEVGPEGTGSDNHDIPATMYAGVVNFKITPKDNGSYVESVEVDGTPVDLKYDNTVASGSFSVENDKSYTVTITYGKATLSVKQNAEVALNLYVNGIDYTARLDGLKGKLLTALLGENVNEDDYEVFVYTKKLTFLGEDGYKSVDDLTLYAGQIQGILDVKITRKASSDGKIPAVSLEKIPVEVTEFRSSATVDVGDVEEITVTDSFAPVTSAVVAATTTNGGEVSAEVVDGELPTPENPKVKVTVKVTVAETADVKGSETTKEVDVKLAQYTITWLDGDGEELTKADAYYGAAVPEYSGDVPSKESTEQYVYTWNNGWEITSGELNKDGTIKENIRYTATFTESDREYTVTWLAGLGTFENTEDEKSDTTQVAYGHKPTHAKPVEPEGMSFEKWELTSGSVDKDGNILGDVEYTAQYTNDTVYTITWNAGEGVFENGSNEKEDSINLTKYPDAVITAPEKNPTREGYAFDGWDGKQEIGKAPSADGRFDAKWILDANGNGVDDAKETLTVKIEGAIETDVVKIGQTTLKADESGIAKYLYNSKEDTILTITAIPTTEGYTIPYVMDRLSSTYVKGISGEGVADFAYDKQFTATATVTLEEAAGEVTVTFAAAKFDVKPLDKRVLNYYYGMDGVENTDVYNTIVNSPSWDKNASVTVEYLAREEGTAQVVNIDDLNLSDILKSALKLLGLNSFTIPQSETWAKLDKKLTPQEVENAKTYTELFNEYLTEEKLQEIYAAYKKAYDEASGLDKLTAGGKAVVAELEKIVTAVQNAAMFVGAHEFGYNVSTSQDMEETIRLTYSNSAMAIKTEQIIILQDMRTPTQLVGSEAATLTYRNFKDADLVALLNLQVQTVDGEAIADQTIEILDGSLEEKSVSENPYAISFRFRGNETYKPSEGTFQVTITKAPASMDIPNLITSYTGDPCVMTHNIVPGNAYGDKAEIEKSLIKFVVGLNVADLSVGENGITGANTVVQLMLPENLKSGIGGLTGNLFKDGMEMSLSDLLKALELIDADSLGVLKQVLEAISNIAGAGDITIKLGGQMPKDIGTYLYGAVSTTGNYETVLDVAYIIIKPDAQQVYLNWNYNDTNGIFTDELLQHVDLGASAYDDESYEVRNADATAKVYNLFFGVNKGEDNKPALALKLYESGIDPKTFDKELGNGGFTQMAFIADFGNTMHYAIPIVRAFAIVPNTVKVQISDEEKTNFRRTYDAQKQELTVTVNGKVPESGLEVSYIGVTTKGKTYNSVIAPTDSGAYVVTAIYRAHDENGKLTGIGVDVKNLLVLPAETQTTVDDAIVTVGETVKLENIIHVTAAVGNPDVTILTAQLATDGSFSEIGMDAVSGNVNVDFPKWVDELLKDKAPEIYKGVTVGELSGILGGKIKTLLENMDLGDELTGNLTKILDQITESLSNLPVDANVTFNDTDATVFSQVGIYLVGAVVTDSNYRVSADYGLVVVKPDVQQVYLDWNYHDENGIWTEELLKNVDLYASAYNDPEFLYKDEKATASITHTFLTVDSSGEVKIYHTADALTYGAYLELAYIELKVDGTMTLSDLIARPIVTMPNTVKVEFVDENNKVNHDRKFTYDGNPHAMAVRVTKNGNAVKVQEGELTVTYRGLTTAGEIYNSSNAPTEAGAYTVTAVYARYEGEKLIDGGVAVGAMVIEPAKVDSFSVTGGIIPYDGQNHGVSVSTMPVQNVQYTLISGTAKVDGAITEIGLEAVEANLNVDFPEWVDTILKEKYPDIFSKGINAQTLIGKLNALNLQETWVNTLVKLLEKVPSDMNVTFQDNIQFKEPGVYVFAGFLTDFNYVPASDTALLVIQKEDSGLKFENTTVYYNGKSQSINVTNPEETDYVTVIVDRENNIANVIFEKNLSDLKELLEEKLGGKIPESINVKRLMETINKVVDDVAAWENLPVDVKDVLEQLKTLLEKLPKSGIIYIDGDWRPVNVGDYEFYGISVSAHYETKLLSAMLEIKPAQISIKVKDAQKMEGEDDPTDVLNITVVNPKGVWQDTDIVDILDIEVSRRKGESVGEYDYSVTYKKNANFEVVNIETGKLTIVAKNAGEDNDKNGKYPIHFDPKDQGDTIYPGAIVEIDGQPYELDENCTAWVDHDNAKIAQTFTYKEGEDAHHTYPTHMYVWYLSFTGDDKAQYDAEPIPELTDFFQYHGTSIRVNFKSNGIRFMTSVDEKNANALIAGNLIRTKVMEGYRMTQSGTLFKWYNGKALTNDGNTASSLVYGIKGESKFRVFQKVNGRNWFTGMLTNLGADKDTLDKDLLSRPYAVLERNGETITIYGGSIQRSIYYVATQNRDWKVGTVYNDYIKKIIAAVEGQ